MEDKLYTDAKPRGSGRMGMKQPLCWAGFTCLASMTAGAFLSWELCIATAAVLALSFAAARFALKNCAAALCVLAASAAAFLVMGVYLRVNYYPALALDGLTAEVSGSVEGIEAGKGRLRCTVRTDTVGIEGAPQKLKLVLTGYGDHDISMGDDIRCTVKLFAFGEETGREELFYLRSGGVSLYAAMTGEPEISEPERQSAAFYAAKLREKLREGIELLLPGWRGELMAKLLIGAGEGLDSGIAYDFRAAGMSHILAVSGLHMVTLTGIAQRALKFAGMKRQKRCLVLIPLALGYILAAGAGFSVVRSGVMLILRYAG